MQEPPTFSVNSSLEEETDSDIKTDAKEAGLGPGVVVGQQGSPAELQGSRSNSRAGLQGSQAELQGSRSNSRAGLQGSQAELQGSRSNSRATAELQAELAELRAEQERRMSLLEKKLEASTREGWTNTAN